MKICQTCRVGRMVSRKMAYIEWHHHNLLVVDRMPVQICDVCGDRDYDDEAIENLQQLLWSKPASIHSRAATTRHTT